jgi:hypothetical protein
MALSFSPFFPQSLKAGVLNIANTNGTATLNVVVGGTNGSKIEAINASSNDSIDHALTLSMNAVGVLYLIGVINVPANSGNLLTSTVNVLGNSKLQSWPLDVNGNRYIYLPNAACSLVVSSNSALQNVNVVSLVVQAGDF